MQFKTLLYKIFNPKNPSQKTSDFNSLDCGDFCYKEFKMLNLKKWAIDYFKFRSNFEKFRLKDVGKNLELIFDEHTEMVYFDNKLKNLKLQKAILITENSTVNRDYLISNWNKFLIPGMKIFFVNKDDSKWAINPKVHNMFIEKNNLKKSIISLFKNST